MTKSKKMPQKLTSSIPAAIACVALLFLLSVVSCSSGSDGPAASYDPVVQTEATAILRSLGVAEVDNPPNLVTTTTTGDTVTIVDPQTWHPLKKDYTVYDPKAEVAQFGLLSGSQYHALYQDGKNSPSYDTSYPLSSETQSWEQSAHKASVAADLDGDGLDEIAVFYILDGLLYLRVYDEGSFSSALQVSAIVLSEYASTGMANTTQYPINYLQAESGDLDGDGNDELILVDYLSAYLLEVNATGSTAGLVGNRVFSSAIRSVSTGDTDGDRADEIAVCLADGQFGCYDSSFSSSLAALSSGTGAVDACFGDFDADNLDELAVAYGGSVHYFEDFRKTTSLTEKSWSHTFTANDVMEMNPLGSYIYSCYYSLPCMRSLDFDGNGYADIYIAGAAYMNPYAGTPTSVAVPNSKIREAQVGDVDGDGMDDVVVTEYSLDIGPADDMTVINFRLSSIAVAYGLDSTGSLEMKKSYQADTLASIIVDTSSNALDSLFQYPSLYSGLVAVAAGNVDNDSPRVKYAGHQLLFTDPVIIAVLVAPPYWSDIAANDADYAGAYTGWETAYGTVTTSSTSAGVSAGFSIGTCVEFEQSGSVFGVKLATVKASASFKQSFDYSVSSDFSISKSITYKGANGEDRVIFTAVPMDIYSYEVVDSPSGEGVGSIMTIELPRNYSTYSVTRDFYNEHNGIVEDIDDDVLQHTSGQPFSYPNAARKASLQASYGGYSSDASVPVAQGVSTTALDIAVEIGTEETIDLATEVEVQGGGGAGGLAVLATAGFTVGFNYTTSTSVGTTFGGTVGYLPTAFYGDSLHDYSSGLFVYPFFDSRDNRSYWIVNYWQE